MKDLLKKEANNEHLRQSLVKRPLFSTYDAFKQLNVSGSGHITRNDLKEVLEDYGVFSTKKDIKQLVDDFDQTKNGKISYSEFM